LSTESTHLPDPFYLEVDQRVSLHSRILREVVGNLLNLFPANSTDQVANFRKHPLKLSLLSIGLLLLLSLDKGLDSGEKVHGVSIFGTESLKYGEHEAFTYLNPDAPKHGTFKTTGGYFTKTTPFGIRGDAPSNIEICFDTLGLKSWDDEEPYAMYGHVVQYYELADDKMSMLLHIRPGITFSDGKPLTSEDVLFSYRLINYPGMSPKWKVYWKTITDMVRVDDMTVKVLFSEYTPDTPVKMSTLTVYPKHIYGIPGTDLAQDFENQLPVGSGPYVIERAEKGARTVYKRRKDYWGDQLPRSRGMFNYDRIEVSVYYDEFSMLQALKSGLIDYTALTLDNYMKLSGVSLDQGYLKKSTFPLTRPSAMQASIFNLRRPLLKDIRLRSVIASLYDFDCINNNVYYGTRFRLVSYFHQQPRIRASSGPAEGRVRDELLRLAEKYNREGQMNIPLEALTRGPYEIGTDHEGKRIPIEQRVMAANLYLDELGWKWDPDVGARRQGDQILSLELLYNEPWIPFFVDRLEQVGIKAVVVNSGSVEGSSRQKSFRYDMCNAWYDGRHAPGREIAKHLLSERADVRGSTAFMGLKNPAVDDVLQQLISVTSRTEMEILSQVFDRIMCANIYLVPNTWPEDDYACYSNKLRGPESYCSGLWFVHNVLWFWWIDPDLEQSLQKAQSDGLPFMATP